MSRSLGVLTLDLIAKTGGFESGMDKAARIADKRTREIERQAKERAKAIETAFMNIGAGIAAAWGALNVAQSVKGVSDLADQLSKLSQRTGVSIDELSALNYAASLNDATMQDLGNGIKGLSNKMLAAQSGSAEAAAAFSALGISATDSTGKLRPVQDVMTDIADAFSKMEDGAGKSAIANKLMEESGIRLIPTLNNGRAGLDGMRQEAERLGGTLQQLAPFSVELNDNITRLNTQGQTLAATIALATVPALNEVAKGLLNASEQTTIFDAAALAAKTTVETLAIVGANVAFVFSGVGNEIGGIAAQLAALGTGDFKAFSAIGDMMKADAKEARAQLDAFEQRVLHPSVLPATAPGIKAPAPALPPVTPGKTTKGGTGQDPLTESAKLYADTMKALDQAQLKADTSGLNLTATQAELVRVISDPMFAQMPEQWREMIAAQAEYTLQAEHTAEQQGRLNELLAATPTAQLEKQRETMAFLAAAFDTGKISAEQFSEAAQTALGNIPEAAKPATDTFLDMTLVANDAANRMAGAFTDYLFNPMDKSIKDMLASFLKAIAQMIAQAMLLKAVKTGMAAMGVPFAKGGAFDQGGVQAFANGGAFHNSVLTRPTPFKFANGGSFSQAVAGEAGPEAVLPLKRGSDGKLGVTMSASDGTTAGSTVINITVNQGGGEEKSSTGSDSTGKALANMIKGAVMNVLVTEQRPGGVLYR